MNAIAPFAYGPVGAVLVTADGREILVHPEVDAGGPMWRQSAAAVVVGVRNVKAGILAVDAEGTLLLLTTT